VRSTSRPAADGAQITPNRRHAHTPPPCSSATRCATPPQALPQRLRAITVRSQDVRDARRDLPRRAGPVPCNEASAMRAELSPFPSRHGDARWDRWRDLAAGAPPFLAPEFFAVSRPLLSGGVPLLAAAWQDARMVGALPLVLDGDTLGAFRTDHTPSFDYVGDDDGLAAIWRQLRDDRRWSTLTLKNVPAGSALATRLPALARGDGCPVVVRPGARHPRFALAGFEARLSPKFLANLQRCARKAGGVALERIPIPSRAALDEALAIEARAWKGAAGTSIAADAAVTHLYAVLARLLGRRGQASLCFLRAGDRRVAMLLAVEDGRTLYALKIGYDPAAVALSPGHLLVWQVATDAERRGLATFDFVGHDDEWTRKWTDQAEAHVHVVIYRRSPRGLAQYALRERLKPRLLAVIPEPRAPLRRGCQRDDVIGTHTTVARVRGRLSRGLGIRSGVRRALRGQPRVDRRLGEPSRFEVGSYVRVLDEPAVRATLDAGDRLRGLAFVPTQWAACGKVYRVAAHVRRMRDDHGRYRPIARTVLLEGVTCAGEGPEPAGCGRHCPLMFRDDWLEPARAPHHGPPAARGGLHARVRDPDEIFAGLDLHGRRDGVTFYPQMAALAGRRFAVANRLTRVFEHDRWVDTPRPVYLLDGVHCDGSALGDRGPCHRACALVWHEDWLVFEEART
jgi:hypothetical protein